MISFKAVKRFGGLMYFIVKDTINFMYRKVILFSLAVVLISCGKDVVIIENPNPPIETDELFEVNLIGFTTDSNRSYISSSKIEIDGKITTSDESGLFHLEKVLIGQKGKIIQVQGDGFLPSIYRAANYQNLEHVILNLEMFQASEKTVVSASGGIIEDTNGKLSISSNSLNSSSDVVFQSFVGKNANDGNSDQLYISDKTEYLLKEASIYVNGSGPLNENAEMEVQLNMDEFETMDISKLSVFQFDLVALVWKQKTIQLSKSGNNLLFTIDDFGWWTIAEKVPAQYGTLNLTQQNDILLNRVEVDISYENDQISGPTYYSSSLGTVSTYFPIDKSITATLNNRQFSEFVTGFTSGESIRDVIFTEEIQNPIDGKVYACDFTLSEGYVAILSEGQHRIMEIDDGLFSGEAFTNDSEVTMQFYSDNLEYLNAKESDIESIKSDQSSFFSCADLDDNLVVTNGSNLLQDFDMCRVKVRPNETVVIGERSNEDVFLVSFEGAIEGQYDGLIYFPEITDTDVKAEVVVNIVLYDEIENKLGGFIKTEYISTGEELSISFIGNIE